MHQETKPFEHFACGNYKNVDSLSIQCEVFND
jgi:hypothetical protein